MADPRLVLMTQSRGSSGNRTEGKTLTIRKGGELKPNYAKIVVGSRGSRGRKAIITGGMSRTRVTIRAARKPIGVAELGNADTNQRETVRLEEPGRMPIKQIVIRQSSL